MPELVCAADSPDWLAERRKGITATDITAITGLSPYESAYSLYFKKRGDIPDEYADNDRLRLGRELEGYILMRWREAVDDETPGLRARLWRSTARPWQLATPDLALGRSIGPDRNHVSVVEVKSWADMDRDRWADGPPARVRAQVLWQMDTLDVATGHVGVLFLPSGEFRSYVIEHTHLPEGGLEWNCRECNDLDLLRGAGLEFMDRLAANDPPSPDASSATLAALKARFTDVHHDKQAEIDEPLWVEYLDWKDDIAGRETKMRQIEALIREQAGEARTLTVNGTRVATRVVSDSAVKAHTRHSDYIRRATTKGDTDGA